MVETYMSTKYELMAELRALNRGMKALPISKMKKHELEHSIDAMKKLKVEKAATPVPPPAKAGRPLSRPIASDSIEDDGVIMHVPKVPKERLVEKRSAPKKKAVEEHLDTSSLFPAVVKRAAEATESRKKQIGTPNKPIITVVHEDSDEEMAKKVKKLQKASEHTHTCNCEGCPKKLIGKMISFE
jgi:hypothetical protein